MILSRKNYYDILYGFRKRIFLIFYALSILFAMILLFLAFNYGFSIPLRIQFLLGFLITIAAFIFGGILSVYFELPTISFEFDKIKNDIAKKVIKSPEEFGKRLTSLLCSFFTFQFFRVEYSFIKIIGSKIVYSNSILKNLEKSNSEYNLDNILTKSKKTEKVFLFNVIEMNSKKYYLYILPIWFGDDWLGFIGFMSHHKIKQIFLNFMNTLENECIDDQLVHVLDHRKSQIQRRFYQKLDIISNNITRQVYSNMISFQKDIIKLMLDEIDCIGGFFVTIYDDEIVNLWKENSEENPKYIDNFKNYFSKDFVPSTPRIIHDNDFEFKFIFEIPIFIDKLQGIILLVDNNDQNFKYFEKTLLEIENIKLDNDLENLAIMLNLQPNENSPII